MPLPKTTTTALSLAGAAALLLAGCSSEPAESDDTATEGSADASASSGAVYDFPLNGMGPVAPGETLTIELPDDLKEAAGDDATKVLVDSFTVSAHELDTAEYCAVDVGVNLVDDDARQTIISSFEGDSTHADDTDGQKIANSTIYQGDIAPIGDLDEANPDDGVYASDDGSEIVAVDDCAASASDDDSDTTLGFIYFDDTHGRLSGKIEQFINFASTDIAVMTDGTVSVPSSKTSDWMRDASGNWIKE